MRLPAFLLLTAICACSTPVATNTWGEQTRRLATALEQSGLTLQSEIEFHFAPDSEELYQSLQAGYMSADELARQVVVWKALDAYTTDIQFALDARNLEMGRPEHVARAFHELHRHLLQSGIADQLGLTIETHQKTVQNILRTHSMVSALEAAQPAIGTLCTQVAAASQGIDISLDQWLDICLQQLDSKWSSELNGYSVLLARKRSMEQELAAQAAGVSNRQGDPAGELLKVETLLRGSDGWRLLYLEEQREMAASFAAARSHSRKTAHAVMEWGIAHREITKAMRNGNNLANLRLLSASADELAPNQN